MKKKFLSLVLACSLMVGSLPFAAYAEDTAAPTPGNTPSTSQAAGDQGKKDTQVTYPTPVAAILADKADQPQTKLYDSYTLTANGNALAISANNLVKHINDNNTDAYWVGAAFPAPEEAVAYSMAADWSPVTESNIPSETESNIANITTDGKSGAVIYTDGVKHKNDTLYVGIQWIGREGVPLGDAQFYTITFADVKALVPATGITLNQSAITLEETDTYQLTATVTPADCSQTVTWSSLDADVATVDQNGLVTAKDHRTTYSDDNATVTITATVGDQTATCEVTVAPKPVSGVTLDKTSVNLYTGTSATLTATVAPSTATYKNVEWSSDDEKVATVNNGVITAVGAGTTTITVTTEDGSKTATCAVTVTEATSVNDESSLKDAITNSADGDAIVLSGDITLTEKLTIDKAITIDGNDHSLSGDSTNTGIYIEISGDNNVTFQNFRQVNAFAGNTATVSGLGMFKVMPGYTGTFTAKNITATNFNRAAFDIRGGNFVIEDCSIDCANDYTGDVLLKGVLVENANGTIKNTKIWNTKSDYETTDGTGWTSNAIETWCNSTVNVIGCTLGETNKPVNNGISMNAGSASSVVNVSDTTINTTKRAFKVSPQKDENNNYAYVTPADKVTGTATINVTGGTFHTTVTDESGLFMINQGQVEGKGCSIVVTGGTFNTDPTAYVPSGYNVTANNSDNPTEWTVTRRSSGGGGGGGSKKDNTTNKADETKQDEVKQEETTTPETIAPGEATSANISQVFGDAKSTDWYAEAAAYVYNNNLMKGDENGNFGANDSATRGQIVTILHRLANTPNAGSSTFSDINGNEYYADGVAWAAELGIVTGYEDGTFGANGSVTREELATILYRFAKIQNWLGDSTGDLSSFTDATATSDWATEALAWAVGTGLLQGDETGALNPTGTATRAEIATILMRFCENIAK